MPNLSVRFDPETLAIIDAAAAKAGQTRSIWAREVLVKTASNGDESVRPHPVRAIQLQKGSSTLPEPKGCRHPNTARRRSAFKEWCAVCGVVTKRT